MHSVSHAKLAPGWALIPDPIQKIGPNVGDGRSFEGKGGGDHFFARRMEASNMHEV